VGLVEDDQVPARRAELVLKLLVREIWSSRTMRWSWSSKGLPLGDALQLAEKTRNSRPNFSNSSSRHCSTRLPGATIRMRGRRRA
jgi:hypothetical protein